MSSRVREDIIMAARQWANAKVLTAVHCVKLRCTGEDPDGALAKIANARVDETNAMEEFFRVLDQGLARVADGPGPQQGEVSGVQAWPRVLSPDEVAEVCEAGLAKRVVRERDETARKLGYGIEPRVQLLGEVQPWPRELRDRARKVYESERDHPHPTSQAAQVSSGEWHHITIREEGEG